MNFPVACLWPFMNRGKSSVAVAEGRRWGLIRPGGGCKFTASSSLAPSWLDVEGDLCWHRGVGAWARNSHRSRGLGGAAKGGGAKWQDTFFLTGCESLRHKRVLTDPPLYLFILPFLSPTPSLPPLPFLPSVMLFFSFYFFYIFFLSSLSVTSTAVIPVTRSTSNLRPSTVLFLNKIIYK